MLEMNLTLLRDQDNGDMTFGQLLAGDMVICQTLERPWVKSDEYIGGTPFKSCLPAGMYKLEPHRSDKFGNTYALVNPSLGVVHAEEFGMRYGILIHWANWVNQLAGCIAPGVSRYPEKNPNMLHNSRIAMADVLEILGVDDFDTLEIRYD